MHDIHADPQLTQPTPELLGHGGAAVLASGASDRESDLALGLLHVPGAHDLEQPHEFVLELLGAGLGQHVVAHVFGQARLGAQLGNPVGVGQEADVEDEIGVDGQT